MDTSSSSTRFGFANTHASWPEHGDRESSEGSTNNSVIYAGSDDENTCAASETPLDMNALRRQRAANLPRFLFRAYYHGSGLRGGSPENNRRFINADGTSKLNSERKITPHAFAIGRGHRDIAEIRDPKGMVEAHIGNRISLSEFSSWSPSLILVLCYAENLYQRSGCVSSHVCVIDTEKVRNSAYSVPDSFSIGLAEGVTGDCYLTLEYLVHGVVKGPSFVALEWSTLRSSVFRLYPAIQSGELGYGQSQRRQFFHSQGHYTAPRGGELGDYLRIAGQFAKRHFVLPIVVKLYCIRRRWPDGASATTLSRDADFLRMARSLAQVITPLTVQQREALQRGFRMNYAFFEEIRQAHTMMKALFLIYPHGRSRQSRGQAIRSNPWVFGSTATDWRRR